MSAHRGYAGDTYAAGYSTNEGGAAADSLQPIQNRTPKSARTVSKINVKANFTNIKREGEDRVMTLTGDVVGYHNGAVITCDSAIQRKQGEFNLLECYGNVIINKETTYIYGDKAIYDDYTGIARVFSPLVKMIDGDAVLYTYNFTFDTYDNIGEYYGGGTVTRGETLLESERGYYYSNTKDFVCVGNAELRDTTYQIISDSMGYNMDMDIANIYRKTYIWNNKGEILSASQGNYFVPEDRYRFTSDAYIMTETRELWADDIDYHASVDDAVLRRNIQIIDHEQSVMGFGDYGQYWGTPGNALLTENPSMLNFDPEQPDTLFMRADSIFLQVLDTLSPFHTVQRNRKADTGSGAPKGAISSQGSQPASTAAESGTTGSIGRGTGDIMSKILESGISKDSLEVIMGGGTSLDSLLNLGGDALDSLASRVGMTAEDLKSIIDGANIPTEYPSEGVEETIGDLIAGGDEHAVTDENGGINEPPAEESEASASEDVVVGDEVPSAPEQSGTPIAADTVVVADDTSKSDRKNNGQSDRRVGKSGKSGRNNTVEAGQGDVPPAEAPVETDEPDGDIIAEPPVVNDSDPDIEKADSEHQETDIETADNESDGVTTESSPEATDSESGSEEPEAEEIPVNIDELEQKVLLAYHNVRVYRSDTQAVCDSLVAFSVDSTMYMHIKPIIWNENNQITSDLVVFYVQNGQLHKAVFSGERPLAGQRLDSKHFNQLTSREIVMFFRDNELYRIDGEGNAETYYYGQDEEDNALTSFITLESSNLTFILENGEISTITYRVNPVAWVYPMDMIPAEQSQIMTGFEWYGHLRPSREDVFNRNIRPSQQTQYMELSRPLFPITDKIHEHRQRLIKSGKWRDRTDTLSEEDQQYVDELRAEEGL